MSELFPPHQTAMLSPRLAWMKALGLKSEKIFPHADGGEDSPETGESIWPWYAGGRRNRSALGRRPLRGRGADELGDPVSGAVVERERGDRVNFLSVCSGIEAASVAWGPLGWKSVGFSEIEKFPSAVLAHHYPSVPNFGDLRKYHEWPKLSVDVLCGGTPCQAFSVAGLRAGLADPRGNLTLTFLGVVERYRPRWVVWENVPGVLSDRTNAFGQFLAGLGELGYGWAYRVLDAQYFGVPQRRRRVFVVGYLGDWRRVAEVLFEPESLRGDSPPSRKTGEGIAPTISSRVKGGGGLGTDFDCDGGLIAHSLRGEGHDASEDGTGRGTPIVPTIDGLIHGIPDVAWTLQERDSKGADSKGADSSTKPGHLLPVAFSCKDHGADASEVSPTLRSMGHSDAPAVAFLPNQAGDTALGMSLPGVPTLRGKTPIGVLSNLSVRRLTPVECERLQGFPDHYTNIPWRGAMTSPDGPRYKALGNSWAIPCVEWIGRRIQAMEYFVP